MIIVVDDEDRENEGDLTIAAEKVTPDGHQLHGDARPRADLPLDDGRAARPARDSAEVNKNTARLGTAFCVSIDAKQGTSTGISAADRAATVLTAIQPTTRPEDLARPGHMFPLRARDGGVLVRAGQTEAAVDLARIGGLYPAGVICEIMNDDGTMARVPHLAKFARRHGLLMITIADLIRYRMRTEGLVRKVASAKLPTDHGEFAVHAFESLIDHETHVALVCGDIGDGEDVLVRVHSKCLTGDVFHSARCDCGDAAAHRHAAHRGGRPRGPALPEPGGARHRPGQQDPGVRAAGPGVRHRRGQRAARLQGRPARLRHRRADPAGTSASGRCGC